MADAVGLAGSIVGLVGFAAQVSKLLYGYCGEAKSAPEDIKQLASEISSLVGLLEPLSTAAEASRISQTPDSEWMSQVVHEFREILERLKGELPHPISEQSDSKPRRVARSLKARLIWPFKKGDTQEQIRKIERLKTAVTMKLQLNQGRQQEDQYVERILEWISSERPGKRHAELVSTRRKDIGSWLLETPEFVDWKTGDPCSVLLGRGIAGAGKTYLSSVVIDHLKEQRDLHGFGVGHIYFDYQEKKQQTVLAVLASLVKQLLSQIPPAKFPKDIEAKYQREKAQHPSANDLVSMLHSMPKWFTRVFVVCDALDEMDQQEQRAELLPVFHKMEASGIALFLTTRPHPADIQDSFQDASTIELVPKEHDIRRYVEERLLADSRFRRIQRDSSGLKNQVVSKIVDSANGIFLLAKFNVDYVLQFSMVPGIRQALSNLSTSERENEQRMDETYDRIMGSIREKPQSIQKYAYRALSWIGYAARTLTVQELLVATSVEANQYHLDDSDIIRFEDLLDYCNGLVISEGQDVRLVHFSVRNYLDRHQAIPEETKEPYHAIACSTYLSFDILKEHQCDHSFNNLIDLTASFPFLNYAANNLTFHLSKVEHKHYLETTSAVMRLLEDQGHRRVYCKINSNIGYPLDIPRLDLACAIGYEDAVRTLLEEGEVDINAKGHRDGLTSLSWACNMGHEKVVKRLLEEGSVVPPQLLSQAILLGRTGMVRIFLEKGVEVNFTYDKENVRQLDQMRSMRRMGMRREMGMMMDDMGRMDFDDFDRMMRGMRMMMRDISGMRMDRDMFDRMNRFMMDREFRMDRELGISPLFHAVLYRSEPIVRLLLERGAKPDFTVESRHYAGASPLTIAKEMASEDLVRLLSSYV